MVFLSLGIVLELFHAFKIGWYLDVTNDTRRLMWTLAHAHGTLLALVNVVFAVTLRVMPEGNGRWRALVSPLLIGSAILVPAGFFLGGLVVYAGDPGLWVFLVPIGVAMLFLGVLLTACDVSSGKRASAPVKDGTA